MNTITNESPGGREVPRRGCGEQDEDRGRSVWKTRRFDAKVLSMASTREVLATRECAESLSRSEGLIVLRRERCVKILHACRLLHCFQHGTTPTVRRRCGLLRLPLWASGHTGGSRQDTRATPVLSMGRRARVVAAASCEHNTVSTFHKICQFLTW